MTAINREILDVKKVVAELYDMKKCGVASFPGFVREEFRMSLENELIGIGERFVEQPRISGKVKQELSSFEISNFSNFPNVLALQKEYIGIFQEIARKAEFEVGGYNSSVVTRYEKGSLGISYHRDYLNDRNLVSVFVVAGAAPFFVASGRNGAGKKGIEATPGSLILLRAPRCKKEERFRPFHRVGRVEKERYTLAIRQTGNC